MIRLITAWLPPHRREWGLAMEAEYQAIEGRRARMAFLVGCARAALSCVLAADRAGIGARIAIVSSGVAVLVLGLTSEVVVSSAPSTGGHGPLWVAATTAVGLALLAVYALVALRLMQVRGPVGPASSRTGLLAGAVIGALVVIANTPLLGDTSQDWTAAALGAVTLVVVAGTALLTGRHVAARTADRRAGAVTGVWMGLASGAVLILGLLAVTLGWVSWFTHDAATIAAYQRSLTVDRGSYVTHFATITGYVRSENQDTALIGGLFLLPIICIIPATVGGLFPRTDTAATGPKDP